LADIWAWGLSVCVKWMPMEWVFVGSYTTHPHTPCH
jgi:hypothetical protein